MKHGTHEALSFSFETEKDAQEFIDQLKDIAEKYEYATLADACDSYGITQYPYDHNGIKLSGLESLKPVVSYQVTITYNYKPW